jgi:hypothetical protein
VAANITIGDILSPDLYRIRRRFWGIRPSHLYPCRIQGFREKQIVVRGRYTSSYLLFLKRFWFWLRKEKYPLNGGGFSFVIELNHKSTKAQKITI